MMNKISYSTNWMGPINTKWIEENGEGWSSGRIDIMGPESPWGGELSLPPIRTEDWNRLSEWLWDFETDTLYTLKELVEEYEKTNPKITWLRERDWCSSSNW